MSSTCRPFIAFVAVTALCGCSMQQESFRGDSVAQMTPAGINGGPQARGTETDFKRELLTNQLRQSELDLQQATTEPERRGVQERIAIIERQMKRLGR